MKTCTQKQGDFVQNYRETKDLIQSAILAGYKNPVMLQNERRGDINGKTF